MINEILKQYVDGASSLEDTNKALKAAGAGFILKPRVESGWTKEEMELGFREPVGEPVEHLPKEPVMVRNKMLAGQTVTQRTQKGDFAVTYDELGYAKKAVKL